jgi:uncharacterized protein YjbJ (UPF0337 family)
MNKEQFTGSWHELKGKVRQQWGKLTDDEIEKVGGSVEQLSGVIQHEYGCSRKEAEKQINDFLNKLH